MAGNTTDGARVSLTFIFTLLFAAFGLAACGGGGASSSDNTSPPDTPPATTYSITATSGGNGSVTPSGTTSVARGASQSYTITPNSGYAVATLVVDGSAVATSTTHTFSSVQANHTISATFSAAPAGGIVVSLVPSRTSGVAPLSVFFDASGTTDAGVTTRPFHDLEYTWSFGDSGSGTWANGAQPGVSSKNSATGPVASHVFETPGTYTVSVTAFDGTDTATTTTSITVTDPDTVFSGIDTTCFSTSGAFADCPNGATHITTSDFLTAMGYQATSRRLLFRRGETFSATGSARITAAGPGIVGAFGTGSPPSISKSGVSDILLLSSATTPALKDWRVMDLDFNGNSIQGVRAIAGAGTIKQFTLLRMRIHDVEFGFVLDGQALDIVKANNPDHTVWDEIAVVDSTISPVIGLNSGWRIYVASQRLSILGNQLGVLSGTGGGTHIIRTPYIGKGVIENNTLARSPLHLNIKMHAPPWCDADSPAGVCICPNNCSVSSFADAHPECADLSGYGSATDLHPIGIYAATSGYTEQVVVSDNKIIGAGSAYLTAIGPQNDQADERVRDINIERNWLQAGGASTRSEIVLSSSETTVRNNICDLTNGSASGRFCVDVRVDGGLAVGPAPVPDQIRIYNNTAYSGDSNSTFAGVLIEQGVSNDIFIANNLAYAPLAATSIFVSASACPACYTASNNSSDPQVKNVSPRFAATPPALLTDWIPTAGSYAINGGTAVPVWSDFFRTNSPRDEVIDVGAVKSP
jgi:hypothetical protein